ncbi:phosphatase PAP2 family protein [Sphingobium aromaticiconvertens]|uniref:phosphatase PAP2 family protein n=1 Tax=Sphingobium aromaticiconvertens TaxID=365341 RepID=UPI003019E3B3
MTRKSRQTNTSGRFAIRSDVTHRWRGAAALAVALALVLAIALPQRWGILTGLNRGLMTAAGQARDTGFGALATPLMQAASFVGETVGRLVLLAVAIVWLLVGRRGWDALWLTATVLGGTLLNLALKQLFAAPRPDLLPHLDIVHSYSFPSGHAAGNLIFFGAIAMLGRRRAGWAIATLCIALIGVSRIWLGVHWPSDVTAGWVEGVGWLLFCAAWQAKTLTRP